LKEQSMRKDEDLFTMLGGAGCGIRGDHISRPTSKGSVERALGVIGMHLAWRAAVAGSPLGLVTDGGDDHQLPAG
jgi:hypothetical protein